MKKITFLLSQLMTAWAKKFAAFVGVLGLLISMVVLFAIPPVHAASDNAVTAPPAKAAMADGIVTVTRVRVIQTSPNPSFGPWYTNGITKTYGDPDFLLNPPSSNSRGNFSYAINDPAIAVVQGNNVTLKGTGVAVVTVTQAPWGGFGAATAKATLTVNPANSSISFPASAYTGTLGAAFNSPVATKRGSSAAINYESTDPSVVAINPATGVVTLLKIGTAIIRATLPADKNYGPSSASYVLTVGPSVSPTPTTTIVATSPSNPTADKPVIITARVSGNVPTGNVTFTDNGKPIGNASVNNGIASITVPLSAGSHTIVAAYGGDSKNSPSNGATTLTVSPASLAATTTTLSSSPSNPTADKPVNLTAQVTPTGGVQPTGTVKFTDNGVDIGTAPLVNGVATLPANLAAGPHNIVASYLGDGNNSPSTSAPVTVNVGPAATKPTTTTLSSSPSNPTVDKPVNLTAQVTPTGGVQPTGTVKFTDNGVDIGTAPLVNGVATLPANLAAGPHNIVASYLGDGNNSPSTSAPVTVNVGPAATKPTTTTLSSSPSNPTADKPVNLTAQVTPTGGIQPTGTVKFTDNGVDIGTAPLVNGVATLPANLAAGPHNIVASYLGDGNNSPSTSAPVTVNVGPAATKPTTTTLSSSPSNPTADKPVNLTAQVTPTGGVQPTGTVKFTDNGVDIGTAPLVNGVATLPANLAAGPHNIVASYLGDGNNSPSTSVPVTVNVGSAAPTPTTTRLTVSNVSPSSGNTIVLTATVSGTGATSPTGTVTFTDNGVQIGTASVVNGVARVTTPVLTPGTHSFSANYLGDSSNNPSSGSAAVDVAKAPTTTRLAVTPPQPAPNSTISLRATVSGVASPTGRVSFRINGNEIAEGFLDSSGIAIAQATAPGVGSYSYTAAYQGDNNNQASEGSFTVNVKTSATTTTLSSLTPNPTSNQPITLVVKVTGTVPLDGQIDILDGNNNIVPQLTSSTLNVDSNGNLTIQVPPGVLAEGVHDLTAVYAGNSNNSASQGRLRLNVQSGMSATTTTLTSPSQNITANQAITLSVRVVGKAPLNGTVNIVNVTTNTNVSSGNVDSNGNLTVSTTGLPAGTYDFVASYQGNQTNAPSQGNYRLIVTAPALAPQQFIVLNSPGNGSYSLPNNGVITSIKIWAVGAGAGGYALAAEDLSNNPSTAGAGGGGAGGVSYRVWDGASFSGQITYQIGVGGRSLPNKMSSTGGGTSVNFMNQVVTAEGGNGAYGGTGNASRGGNACGGSSGGGAIGGSDCMIGIGNMGMGARDVLGLQSAVQNAGYTWSSQGTPAATSAVAVGNGGGAALMGSGPGEQAGDGFMGGGGGGGTARGGVPLSGGNGGNGFVLIQIN